MQGTVLIIDGIATNRIMLKVQLSAAYYRVVQAESMAGLTELVRRARPDLIVAAMSLPDGGAIAVHRALHDDPVLGDIPIIAVADENDRGARLAALGAGIDDVLCQPLDDLLLQARIRSLIRARDSAADLQVHDATTAAMGFGEPVRPFQPPARVTLLTTGAATGQSWAAQLAGHVSTPLTCHQADDAAALMAEPVADAFVVEISGDPKQSGLQLVADLRSRSTTRHSAIIAVVDPPDSAGAASALDRGANDVVQRGFCPEELALRLNAQLRSKARSDRGRASVRDGLRAAVQDPLTGLYNRRYALPHLTQTVRQAASSGAPFAVMLADLDHFKRINDCYGHPVGDAVLIEAATRLRSSMRAGDMIARVGGEEFLIVMPDIDRAAAIKAADRLCRQIDGRPFRIDGSDQAIAVTISIGVVTGTPDTWRGTGDEPDADWLIAQADRALYESKDGGRNKVTLTPSAA